jgi:hypothetical protein
MDLHITDSSSVVIEAGWMGVKSCILNSGFNEGGVYSSCYQKEKEVGLAKVIPQEPDAIMRWIEESLKVKEKSNHNYIINNNLDMFIDSIGSG